MRRGTTPTHTFTLPFDTAMLSKVRIIYSQGNSPVVTRDNADLHGKDRYGKAYAGRNTEI
jgi:hypothetical protein